MFRLPFSAFWRGAMNSISQMKTLVAILQMEIPLPEEATYLNFPKRKKNLANMLQCRANRIRKRRRRNQIAKRSRQINQRRAKNK